MNDGYQASGSQNTCLSLTWLESCGYTKFKYISGTRQPNYYYSVGDAYGYGVFMDLNTEYTIDYSDMTKWLGFYFQVVSQDRTNYWARVQIY